MIAVKKGNQRKAVEGVAKMVAWQEEETKMES